MTDPNDDIQIKIDEILRRIDTIAKRGDLRWSQEAKDEVEQIHRHLLHLQEVLGLKK